jgi:hypothetical protein
MHSLFSIEILPLFFMLPVGHLSLASPRAHFTQPAAVDYDMRMCSASIAAELRRDEGDIYIRTFLFILREQQHC